MIPEDAFLDLVHEDGKGFGHDHWDLGWDFSDPGWVKRHIKSDGDKSALIYNIRFTEKKQTQIQVDQMLGDEQLKWGDSKVYTITDGSTYKAFYIDPAGHQVGIAANDETNPYIHIKQLGNEIIVAMAPFGK